MKRSSLAINFLIIFSLSFNLLILFVWVSGVKIQNNLILPFLIICGLCTLFSSILFWEDAIKKIGDITIQLIFIVLINLTFIFANFILHWNFKWYHYIIHFISTVAAYILIRWIIFQVDKKEAAEMNKFLKKRKKTQGRGK